LVGCGFYAGPAAAVAATGIGEEIIRRMLSRTVYDWIAHGEDVRQACERDVVRPRHRPCVLDHRRRRAVAAVERHDPELDAIVVEERVARRQARPLPERLPDQCLGVPVRQEGVALARVVTLPDLVLPQEPHSVHPAQDLHERFESSTSKLCRIGDHGAHGNTSLESAAPASSALATCKASKLRAASQPATRPARQPSGC